MSVSVLRNPREGPPSSIGTTNTNNFTQLGMECSKNDYKVRAEGVSGR